MNTKIKSLFTLGAIFLTIFGSVLSIYVPNEVDQSPKPYTTGLKIKTYYQTLSEPYYHANYSKVYIHNKNYTSSLLDNSGSYSSHSQDTQPHPVYISEEKKEKIKNVLKEHNTNVVDKDTLNNRVVYKRRIARNKNIEVFNKCPEGVTGQFVYDLACNQYLDCWNGRGGPRNCAPGTLFNPKTLECDFPEKVECLTGPTGSSLTLQKSAKLQSPHEQAKCPQDFSGLIPNYTDCSKFVQCNNGIQTPRDCPPGTLFDTNLNVCNHAREAVCFSGQPGSSYDIKEEYGGSSDISGQYGRTKWQTQGGQPSGQYTQQHWQYQGQGNAYGGSTSQHQGQSGQYWNQQGYSTGQSQSNRLDQDQASRTTYGGQHYQTSGSTCDPTNPYCKSGGYIISGHNIYNMDGTPGSGPSKSAGTVYIQYVMCNPSTEDCSSFQQGTYMLGPGGALCNPANQQCGRGTAYIPSNKMTTSSSSYGQNALPSSGTYFVKYVMCNTAQEDCSQYQKGIIEAGYGVPGTLIGAQPVEESGCNPQTQKCGTTQYQTSSYGQTSGTVDASGQPCNPQYQECGHIPQGQFGPIIPSGQDQYQGQSGTTVFSTGQVSGQPCNPQYQKCGQGSQGSTVHYQGQYTSPVSTGSQISGAHGKSGQPCNPQYQQCGQTSGGSVTYQGQQRPGATVTSSGQVSRQPCNPQYQDCGQGSQGTTVYYQGQYIPSVSSGSQITGGQPCNPQYQQCSQTSGNSVTYQGQQGPGATVSSSGQVSGGHGKSGQPCNPQYQDCGQRGEYVPSVSSGSQISGGQPCNPQYQQCGQTSGSSVTYQGQQRPGISSYDQIYESQGAGENSGASGTQGYGQKPGYPGYSSQTYSSTTNYKTVCTAGDDNCYRNQGSQGRNSEPKCPYGFQGITEHPTNCKKFLNCANGITYIQDCAPGTLFNPLLKICDFPYNVDCKINDGETTTVGYGQETEDYDQQGAYGRIQGYPGCQGQACQGQTPCQGTHCTNRQGYGSQVQSNVPGQGQPQGYGQGTSHGRSECVGSQCSYRPSSLGQGQNRCQGGECGYNVQGQTGYQGQTGCQGHQCQSQRVNDGQRQMQIYEEETTARPTRIPQSRTTRGPTTIITAENSHIMRIPSKTTHQGVQPINKPDRVTSGGFNNQKSIDYVDIFDPDESRNLAYATTQKPPKKVEKQVWPPPFPEPPTTDLSADYYFEYENGEPVTLAPENVQVEKKKKTRCGDDDFMCEKRSCIEKNFVCDGVRDCDDGKDEKYCQKYLDEFKPYKNSRLDVLEKQRWDNVTYSTCALLCMDNKKFECKSFNYRKVDKACFLTNENIGSSGSLKNYYPCDYHERKSTSFDCTDMHKCPSGKCLTSDQMCDGYDDCGDRADEKGCRPEDFGYSVKLAAGEERHEGRVEVTVFGKTGYICDDQFSITNADVLCKELGFKLGALEVKGNSYFAKDLQENNTLYMMDDIECLGNETSIMQCNFAGWGIHNCADREIAGVVCKTPQETCSEGYWKCDTGNECVRLPFVCDGLDDCSDNSDEASHNCDSPTELRLVNGTKQNEGRLEIRHNGIWGSICDDDFNEDAAKIVCNSLGYAGSVFVKKDAFFGESTGPIWLDQVSCKGNESRLEKCTHWDWGEHNCDHSEDVGIVCSNSYFTVEPKRSSKNYGGETIGAINALDNRASSPEPVSCGYRKDNIFLQSDDVHFRVVQGSVATPGEYPWQAALRIKGQEKTAHWCGAVVIASKWVLTAAHCLEGYTKGAYVVVAGEYNTDENEGTEQQAYIEEYYLHENFRKGHKMGNDIALILLKGDGFRLNQDIQPICLPDENADYERDLNCTVSGFGTVQTGRAAYSHKLRAAWIPIQKMDVCKMAHIYGEHLTDGMICAGDLTGGVDACDGDSGGPLACLEDGVFTLYGLTSWGQRCGYANKPGVYVKVSHYKKWIENIMKLHS